MINDIFLWMMALPQFWLQVMWAGSFVGIFVIAGVLRIWQ
jgi:hypothetical protein